MLIHLQSMSIWMLGMNRKWWMRRMNERGKWKIFARSSRSRSSSVRSCAVSTCTMVARSSSAARLWCCPKAATLRNSAFSSCSPTWYVPTFVAVVVLPDWRTLAECLACRFWCSRAAAPPAPAQRASAAPASRARRPSPSPRCRAPSRRRCTCRTRYSFVLRSCWRSIRSTHRRAPSYRT